ncbi:LysR family transcriptional regulator [Kitasatospora sp. NPDC094016]|uniref:LysR family transcriptional regulator n=1 Tax=Kitasatospora sp. NPDC094016 TaxID=3154986 RepID=UPI003326A65D
MKVTSLDLNLLIVLDAVLEEGSVTAAAHRLNLSVPAASRALGRLRTAFADPLLVRSSRGMKPTAHALALRPRVRALVEDAQNLLGPAEEDTVATLRRAFAVLAPEDLIGCFGSDLLTRMRAEAPGVQLRLLSEGRAADEGATVREGAADIAISVNTPKEADLRSEGLVREPLLGVVRAGHPLSHGHVTAARFAAWEHIVVSRHGRLHTATDRLLEAEGVRRTVAASVPDFTTALRLIATSDLVGIAPAALARNLADQLQLALFPVPLDLKPLRISLLWHPRRENDPSHQWLLTRIREAAGRPAGRHGAGSSTPRRVPAQEGAHPVQRGTCP